MKQTILIHGTPDSKDQYLSPGRAALSDANWFPWIKREMELQDEMLQSLQFPTPYNINYEKWVEVFEQMKINSETTLIGHSCGGGFLLRYFSEHPSLIPKQLILVAPWIDPTKKDFPFFDFSIDTSITDRLKLHIFISSNDQESVAESCNIIKTALPHAMYHELGDRGHFEEKTFPELLELLQ